MAKSKSQRKGGKNPKRRESGGATRSGGGGRRKLPNWLLLVPALVGVALTGYLTFAALGTAPLPYCDEGSSCDIVQGSRWGTFLGLPTAFWGLLGYVALAWVAWRVRDALWHWRMASVLSLVGISISLYLTAVSIWIIGATCFYCLISLALWAIIAGVTVTQTPWSLPDFSWPAWLGQSAVLVVVVVAGLHMHYSGVFNAAAGPEDPYLKALATHLTESGAIFYGAFW